MKALRYIDNTGVMRVQVVPDDYELTRDEQRRLGKDFWFEGLYEALGAKDDHDKKRKGQPAEPWLKEFVTPGDRQVATNMLFYGAKDPEDYGLSPGVLAITFDGFGLASRYPEAVGGPGAPDDREEPQTDWEALFRAANACATAANEALCAERIEYAELKTKFEALRAERDALDRQLDGARGCLAEQTARAEKAEAENARLRELAEALADAADDVGVQHFDTDTIPEYVGTMQAATLAVRAALAPVESKGGDDGR